MEAERTRRALRIEVSGLVGEVEAVTLPVGERASLLCRLTCG